MEYWCEALFTCMHMKLKKNDVKWLKMKVLGMFKGELAKEIWRFLSWLCSQCPKKPCVG
jgi:hypothetical protein